MTLYYLLALKYNSDSGSLKPNLRTFESLEKMYLYLEKTYNEELSSMSTVDVFNRNNFIMMYNRGGVNIDEELNLYFKSGDVNSDIDFGEFGHCGETWEFIENPKVSYTYIVHTELGEDNETKKCIYTDINLDSKKIVCGKDVQDKGYCKDHLYYFLELNRKEEAVTEKETPYIEAVQSKYLPYIYIVKGKKLVIDGNGTIFGKCISEKLEKLDENDIAFVKELGLIYDTTSDEAKKLLTAKI